MPSKDALQHDWPNLRDCTKAGDPEARLELAVRYARLVLGPGKHKCLLAHVIRFLSSFCLKGTMSRQEQLEWAATLLSAIARPEDPEYIEEIDTLTRAKAWSCMAMVCLEEVKHPRTTIRDLQGGLFQAANYADGSVRCGLVSEAVLRTCERIQDFDYRLRYDPPFKSFIALWAVWDKVRIIRAREAEREQRDKASKAPNAYICAAPGCGIEATKKVAFKACGGPCPLNTKPHYCSKECQVKVCRAPYRHIPLYLPSDLFVRIGLLTARFASPDPKLPGQRRRLGMSRKWSR